MKSQTSHLTSLTKHTIPESNSSAMAFSAKHQVYSAYENKNQHPISSNSSAVTKNPKKFSKLESLNNSHFSSVNEDKRASPMIMGYVNTEPQRDLAYGSGLKRSTRLNTGESEKLRRFETSFDSVYNNDRQRNKRNILPSCYTGNSRVYSQSRVRNQLSKENPIVKNVDENTMDARKGKIFQEKRASAVMDKDPMDSSLPSIYMNNDKYKRERIGNNRLSNGMRETPEPQTIEAFDTSSKVSKKGINFLNKMPKMTAAGKNENSKFLKTLKVKPENSLAPFGKKLISNMKSTHSLTTAGLSPEKSGRSDSPDFSNTQIYRGNINLLDALDPKKHTGSIDHQFDKVNELTNKNNIARYDLLKIQESALELRMRLDGRKPQGGKNARDTNTMYKTNTIIEEYESQNHLLEAEHAP